jgi:hypothetical protein
MSVGGKQPIFRPLKGLGLGLASLDRYSTCPDVGVVNQIALARSVVKLAFVCMAGQGHAV